MGTSPTAAGHSLSATILRSAATVALFVFLATGAHAGERHERPFVTQQDLGFLPIGKSAVRDGDFDLAARNAVRDLVRASVEDFSVRSVRHDRLGGTHTRMRQTINGLPVDVVAHELTHGVTDYESDLIYANESSGDADLYVRFGSQPTTSSWDCRPYRWGNNESCSFNPPQAGTYHIMLRAYSSFSGVDLTAQHE